jgi:hypothetical protein
MAYQVPAAANIGANAYTITGVIQLMAGANPPANIAFPQLGNPPNTHDLGPNQGMPVQMSPFPEVTRAWGLITCASVCYVNSANALAYVFHANAGGVSHAQFMAAMVAIGSGGPAHNTVYIAYAHPNATDAGYQATINDFVAWGVPTNNIVEITNLFLNQFGMNNLLQIGY